MKRAFLSAGIGLIAIGLVGCSLAPEQATIPLVTEGGAPSASETTWLITSSYGEGEIARLDWKTGTAEKVSSEASGVFSISGDNMYQVTSRTDLSVSVASLAGESDVVFDITEMTEYSLDDVVVGAIFAPNLPHALRVIIGSEMDGGGALDHPLTVWEYTLSDLSKPPVLVQSVAPAQREYVDYFNYMDGSLITKAGNANPAFEPSDADLDSYGKDSEIPFSREEAARDLTMLFEREAETGGTADGQTYPFGTYLTGADSGAIETNDGAQWKVLQDGTSLIVFTRTGSSGEWKKTGKTIRDYPLMGTGWLKPSGQFE